MCDSATPSQGIRCAQRDKDNNRFKEYRRRPHIVIAPVQDAGKGVNDISNSAISGQQNDGLLDSFGSIREEERPGQGDDGLSRCGGVGGVFDVVLIKNWFEGFVIIFLGFVASRKNRDNDVYLSVWKEMMREKLRAVGSHVWQR